MENLSSWMFKRTEYLEVFELSFFELKMVCLRLDRLLALIYDGPFFLLALNLFCFNGSSRLCLWMDKISDIVVVLRTWLCGALCGIGASLDSEYPHWIILQQWSHTTEMIRRLMESYYINDPILQKWSVLQFTENGCCASGAMAAIISCGSFLQR